MKSLLKLLLVLLGFSQLQVADAQKFNSPVEYMEFIGKEYQAIVKDTWDYIGAVAHGKSAKKVAAKRAELLKTSQNAKSNVARMGAYDGDTEYRDSVLSFLKLNYTVLNGDYEKIMNLEEIAEQSYDAMEAYLLAQEIASDKLQAASEMVSAEQKKYAARHNITLVESKDPMAEKMKIAGEVMDYYNVLYLIFFKSYKQELYLIDAMNKNDINGMEQNKNTLLKFAEEGLKKLEGIANYKNDGSVVKACVDMLTFYKEEASEKIGDLINFQMKKENYEKIKKAFDAKKASDRTQTDVDAINNAGKEFNDAVAVFNKTNEELNKKRTLLLNNWNKSVQLFLDKNVPRGK